MNPLELFQDPTVTDVLVDSTKSIQVVREGKLQTIGEYFSDDLELQNFAKQQIRNANGRIDLAKPFAEVNIAGEFGQLRFHAILAGQCSFGTQVSIRRHPVKQLSLEDLLTLRTIGNSQLQKLKEIITLRSNFVIIGAT